MIKKKELAQLVAERDQFIQQANERIAWYNGRIHQLQQQSLLVRWWRRLKSDNG